MHLSLRLTFQLQARLLCFARCPHRLATSSGVQGAFSLTRTYMWLTEYYHNRRLGNESLTTNDEIPERWAGCFAAIIFRGRLVYNKWCY